MDFEILKTICNNTVNIIKKVQNMKKSRLEQLEDFYREDPNDPFIIYCLATEYWKSDINKALFYFEGLLKWHPYYVGTYYHAAKLYEELNRREDAEKTYLAGIEIAKEAGNNKLMNELQAAYTNFQFEE